jgi:hypothetical protein
MPSQGTRFRKTKLRDRVPDETRHRLVTSYHASSRLMTRMRLKANDIARGHGVRAVPTLLFTQELGSLPDLLLIIARSIAGCPEGRQSLSAAAVCSGR